MKAKYLWSIIIIVMVISICIQNYMYEAQNAMQGFIMVLIAFGISILSVYLAEQLYMKIINKKKTKIENEWDENY